MTVSIRPKGLTVARLAIARAIARGMGTGADYAAHRWGETDEATRLLLKATVPAGSVSGETFGDPSDRDAMTEFFSLVAPKTIPGRLQGLRALPFRVKTLRPTAALPTQWIGEGAGKPIGALQFSKENGLEPRKVISMCVVTQEALQSTDPKAELWIRNEMARSLASAINIAFIDPDNAGDPGIKPAAVTYNLSAIGGGSPTTSFDDDFEELIANFAGDLERAFIVTTPLIAVRLSGAARPNVGARGGEIAGIPTIVSTDVPSGTIALVDPDGIAFAEGAGGVRTSEQGSVEMVDSSTQNSATPAASEMVSMWQTGSKAILTERFCNWLVVRPGAVGLITNATY